MKINIELTEKNLLNIVPEIIDKCYDFIDIHNKVGFTEIMLDNIVWGELEEITPNTSFRPSYNAVMAKGISPEDEGIVIVDFDRVILKPWKGVNRFFRVLSFRCDFDEWY